MSLPKLILRSHGLKRIECTEPDYRIIPKADFYIDCRGIQEKGISGSSGDDVKFQAGVLGHSPHSIEAALTLILDSLNHVETRRQGENPTARPYVVCFMCAWGVHRSVAVKHIAARKLKALGLDVKVE